MLNFAQPARQTFAFTLKRLLNRVLNRFQLKYFLKEFRRYDIMALSKAFLRFPWLQPPASSHRKQPVSVLQIHIRRHESAWLTHCRIKVLPLSFKIKSLKLQYKKAFEEQRLEKSWFAGLMQYIAWGRNSSPGIIRVS